MPALEPLPPINKPLAKSDVKLATSGESRHFVALHYNNSKASLGISNLREKLKESIKDSSDSKSKKKPASVERQSSTSSKARRTSTPIKASELRSLGNRAPHFCFNSGIATTQGELLEFLREANMQNVTQNVISNYGNTCFANAALQLLASTRT